jgi:hypothetical protein
MSTGKVTGYWSLRTTRRQGEAGTVWANRSGKTETLKHEYCSEKREKTAFVRAAVERKRKKNLLKGPVLRKN